MFNAVIGAVEAFCSRSLPTSLSLPLSGWRYVLQDNAINDSHSLSACRSMRLKRTDTDNGLYFSPKARFEQIEIFALFFFLVTHHCDTQSKRMSGSKPCTPLAPASPKKGPHGLDGAVEKYFCKGANGSEQAC